jgi:hypothetical protein
LTTDSSSVSTGSIITAGGVGIAKALYVGTNANVAGTLAVTGVATFSATPIYSSLTASSAVATDASKNLVSVTNTGTGNNVLATSPTLVTPILGAASATSITFDAGAVGTPSITTTGDTNTGIFFPAADTIAFAEGGAEAMRIDSSGNLVLGTTSASGKFTISDNSGGAGVANTVVLTNGVDANCYLSLTGSSATDKRIVIGPSTGTALAFQTNATERMRIDSGGFTYINCTSSVGAAGAYSNILFDGAAYFGMSIKTSYGSAGSTFAAFINSAGTQQGAIYANATNTTQYQTSSDYRLKENIVPMTGALDKVSQLKPCTFKWKSDGSASQGFIAHELQTVVPECVGGEKDAVDADGNPKYQGVDTSFLVATLTAAIQEQQALITALTAQITAQQASLDSLTARIIALEAK